MADEQVASGRECERRALRRTGGHGYFVGPIAMRTLGPGAMTRVERRIADQPLVVDGVVVLDDVRDWDAGRDADGCRFELRVVDPHVDDDRARRFGRRAGARRCCGERQRDETAKDACHLVAFAVAGVRRRSRPPTPTSVSAKIAKPVIAGPWSRIGVDVRGSSSPAATGDGGVAVAEIARSYLSCAADALITTL